MRNLLKSLGLFIPFIGIVASVGAQNINKGTDSTKKSVTSSKKIAIKIKVIDIEDGSPLDSAKVSIPGSRVAYTNEQGIVLMNDVFTTVNATVSATNYIAQTKKVKASILFRLSKSRSKNNTDLSYQYGKYTRPNDFVTSAVVNVSGDELRRINSTNLINALSIADPAFITLQNNNSGSDPNVLPNTQIRGSANFPASASIATKSTATSTGVQILPSSGDFVASQVMNANQPVYLLDGVQVSLQQVVDMDIYKIEKVSLLKDAASTAAYGSRAANGIVLIQTKERQSGNMNLRYSGQLQFSSADLSSYNLLNASDKITLENKANFYNNNNALYQQRIARVNKYGSTDWLHIPLQTSVSNYHSLMLDGGDDNFEYGLDFGYKDINGVMKGSERNAFEVGVHIGARFKSFVLKNYMNYTKVHASNSPYGNFADYEKLNGYWLPYDTITGDYAKVLDQYNAPLPGGGTYPLTVFNPAFNSTLSTTNTTDYNRFSNTTKFDWTLGKGFTLNGRVGANLQMDENDVFLSPGNTAFANYSPSDFFKRGLYTQTNSKFSAIDGSVQLNYFKHINLHFINATTGVTALATSSDAESVIVQGFTSDQMANIAFGSGYSNSKPSTGQINNRSVATFANVTYSYDQRYQAEATFTNEGVSQFSDNNRYANYWSGGLSWNIHNEHFFHTNNIVSQLRLRANTGVVGSQFFQSYLSNTTYNYFTNQQYILGGSNAGTRGVGLGAFLTGVGNQNLKSPLSTQSNIGLDLVMFKNRLFIRAERFWQKSTDLVLPIYSPNYTGFRNFAYYDNLGSIENNGYEFSVAYAVISNAKKSIYWNVNFNGMHYVNSIKATSSYLDSLNAYNNSSSVNQTQPQALYKVDNSLTAIWGVRSLGIDPATGQEKFVKADGTTTTTWSAADKQMLGDYTPTLRGSFGSTLSVKNISFAAYFNYQFGGKFYNQTLADKVENADLNYNVDARATNGRWQNAGDNVPFKALSINGLMTSPTYVTSRFVESNDLINCASISLGYTWLQFKSKNIPLQNTTVAFMGNNLFAIEKNNNWEKGLAYPFAKTFTLKLTTSIR